MKKKKIIITVCVGLVALVRAFTPYLGRPFFIFFNTHLVDGGIKSGFCLSNKVKSIYSLKADDPSIKYIKYCTELEKIFVFNVRRSDDIIPVDINDISNPNLKSIQISGEAVNWSSLNKCTELENLMVLNSNFSTCEDISELKKLETMWIHTIKSDISLNKLNELQNLKELEINCWNDINWTEPLQLKNLKYFEIRSADDIDCDNFSQLENLKVLHLATTGKISGLDKLDSVTSLTISSNQEIGDEICGMDNLKELHLYDTKLSEEVESALREKGVIIKHQS